MIIFDKINSHFDNNLPFVVYRKPHENILKGFFQNNKNLDFINDYSEKGFVFCSFDGSQNIIFEEQNCAVYSENYNHKLQIDTKKTINVSNKLLKSKHLALVQKAIDAILNSEFTKVVLSRKEEISVHNFDKISTFENFLNLNKSSFCYIWFHPKVGFWMGAFSEQLVKISNFELRTMSLAGTKKNDGFESFQWQQKEIDEQQIVTKFIAESLQNEISHINIEKPVTVKSQNLLHLKSDITAVLNSNYSLKSLLQKLHPTPAVCGFPKDVSKAFILKNEKYNREFYAGFLGEMNIIDDLLVHNTDLFVNLRCIKIDDAHVSFYVGGGITKDSNPVSEWEETVNKSMAAKSVLNLI